MLLQRIRTVPKPRRAWVRWNSSDVSYPRQVRAYPFAVDKDEAIRYVSPVAGLFSVGQGFFSSVGARFLPWLGFEPKQPTMAAAVYIPSWIIDAELQANVKIPSGDGEAVSRKVLAQFVNSYMPGLAYDPLSRMSFKDQRKSKSFAYDTVPWSPKLATQHGLEIMCLPYTLTPFSLPDAVCSLPFHAGTIQEDFTFDPKHIETHFLAGYPVLMPAYLFQYEVDFRVFGRDTLTLVVDASRPKGRIMLENVVRSWQDKLSANPSGDGPLSSMARIIRMFDFIQIDSNSLMPVLGMRFASIERLLNVSRSAERTRQLQAWIDMKVDEAGVMEQYRQFEREKRKEATGSPEINWDDLRIREYTEKEVQAIFMYMMLGAETAMLDHMRESLANISGKVVSLHISSTRSKSAVDSSKPGLRMEDSDRFLQDLKKQSEKLEKQKEQLKPAWLKDWEAQQKPTEEKPVEQPAVDKSEENIAEEKPAEVKVEQRESEQTKPEEKKPEEKRPEEKKPDQSS